MIVEKDSKVALVLGDDVSTDTIYPGRYMATVLPAETPQFAFADIKEFTTRVKTGEISAGSILVAGENFGCGSSREQAVSCLCGLGLIVIVKGIARIFLQNAINLGLKVVICPDLEAKEGDRLEITGEMVINHRTGRSHNILPLPKSRQAIMEAGGLIPYTRNRLQDRNRI